MKNRKPVIGIIPTFNLMNPENDPYQDRASFVTMYSSLIEEVGGIPIGILTKNVSDYTKICDGYLWPGGNKIEKEYFSIIKDAIENKKPFLGICLGAQGIATYLNIREDQKNASSKAWEEIFKENKENNPYLKKLQEANIHSHYVTKEKEVIEKAYHAIKIEKESLLYDIYRTENLKVISLHSFAIARTSKDTSISAFAEDNEIEAIEYREKGALLLGILWHPEIINDKKVFEWLISSCRKYQILVNRENKINYRTNYKIVEYNSAYPDCVKDSRRRDT